MTVPAEVRGIVSKAKRDGTLIPQPCEECGATPTDGHHDDYSKPLNVRWLCRSCHKLWHGAQRPDSADIFLTVRIPRELRDALNAQADRNERTAAAEVRIALRKHLRKTLAESPSRQEV